MKKIDLTGKIFGRLVVLRQADVKIRNRPAWICKCECGNEKMISGKELRVGDTKSCGCYLKDLLIENLLGKCFHKLTVKNKAQRNGKSTSQFWQCECVCGKQRIISARHLKLGHVTSCGCEKEIRKSENDVLEFHKNIEKTESCWVWTGLKGKRYGIFFTNKMIKPHRFSYMLFKGDIPNELIVCHKCGNSLCVNPDHLYIGTHSDNMADSFKHGTRRKTLIAR